MKKLLVILLAITMVFSFAACGEDPATSSDSAASQASQATTSKGDTSKATSKDTSKETSKEVSNATSSAAESSSATESTTSGDTTIPEFTNKYVSFGLKNSAGKPVFIDTTVRATDSKSIRLTKINEAPVAGDIVLFTKDYGTTIASGSETYADFAILVCTYTHSVFSYTKTSLTQVGEDKTKASTKIPADGFVVAISKLQETEIKHLANIKDGDLFFVHGVQIGDVGISLSKATKAPTIDGKISAAEYGAAKYVVDENNILWNYSQFNGQYYATAEVYATYDSKNLYLGVVVNSPNHYCPLAADKASGMWQYECIQVNVSSQDPLGEYISEHFDYVVDPKAPQENVVRQYGFAVSDTNESLSCVWIGNPTTTTAKTVSIRDDTKQTTSYEVAIPWSEIGSSTQPFDINTAKVFGLSISVNSTSEDDTGANVWKNIMMRDGGGIIARNDFSKIARVELK